MTTVLIVIATLIVLDLGAAGLGVIASVISNAWSH